MDGRVRIMAGLRADFSTSVSVRMANSEPGGGAEEGDVMGGGGCGGEDSLGRVYCQSPR